MAAAPAAAAAGANLLHRWKAALATWPAPQDDGRAAGRGPLGPAVLTSQALALAIAAYLPAKDLGSVAAALRASRFDEHFWRRRLECEFPAEARLRGSRSGLDAFKECALLHLKTLVGASARAEAVRVQVLVVGDDAVGKSALVGRLVDDVFIGQKYVSTIGIDFKIMWARVAQRDMRVVLWDTAGIRRFRINPRKVCTGCSLILVCYDATRRETFERLGEHIDNITRTQDSSCICAVCIVACKCDLVSDRQVSLEEGAAFADACRSRLHWASVHFGETNALTGAGAEKVLARVLKAHVQRLPPQPPQPKEVARWSFLPRSIGRPPAPPPNHPHSAAKNSGSFRLRAADLQTSARPAPLLPPPPDLTGCSVM